MPDAISTQSNPAGSTTPAGFAPSESLTTSGTPLDAPTSSTSTGIKSPDATSVPVPTAAEQNSKSQSPRTTIAVGLVAVALALILGAVGILCWRRRRIGAQRQRSGGNETMAVHVDAVQDGVVPNRPGAWSVIERHGELSICLLTVELYFHRTSPLALSASATLRVLPMGFAPAEGDRTCIPRLDRPSSNRDHSRRSTARSSSRSWSGIRDIDRRRGRERARQDESKRADHVRVRRRRASCGRAAGQDGRTCGRARARDGVAASAVPVL
ncbi:hypothetical protein C8Q76DRAFT_470151 [Earliella scabrosa]|nr:hypothetical protein C8Q76DRAFT_470151 [Earliella scabrosa]